MAEEGAPGRRGERGDEGPAERGPGAAFHMFVLMEDLLDKLKLLSYEEEALRRHNMRPLSRCSRPAAAPRAGAAAGGGRREGIPPGRQSRAKEGRARMAGCLAQGQTRQLQSFPCELEAFKTRGLAKG